VTPDPRLVEALAEALHVQTFGCFYDDEHEGVQDPCPQGWHDSMALAILPAFLDDGRTHEWLAERIRLTPRDIEIESIDDFHEWWATPRELAAAILGADDA
jgi:hypothetical protein